MRNLQEEHVDIWCRSCGFKGTAVAAHIPYGKWTMVVSLVLSLMGIGIVFVVAWLWWVGRKRRTTCPQCGDFGLFDEPFGDYTPGGEELWFQAKDKDKRCVLLNILFALACVVIAVGMMAYYRSLAR